MRVPVICVVVLAFVFAIPTNVMAQVQRMVVPSGTQVKLLANGTSRVAARCVDPHLPGPSGQTFSHVASDSRVVVRFEDGRSIPLAEAVQSGEIKITGEYPEMVFRSTVDVGATIEFISPSVMASSRNQARDLDRLQTLFGDVGTEASARDVWNGRYRYELERMGYGDGSEDSIRSFQADWDIPTTGELCWQTEIAIDDFLWAAEICEPVTADDGKILTIQRMRREDAPMFRLIDAETGVPLRRENGEVFETDNVAELGDTIRTAGDPDRSVEYVRLVGFDGDEAAAFASTIELNRIHAVGPSLKFFQRRARLIDGVSEVVEKADGSFEVSIDILVDEQSLGARLAARARQAVTAAKSAIASYFKNTDESDATIRAAIREARLAARTAAPESPLQVYFTDEFGNTQLVELHEDLWHEDNAAARLALLGWGAAYPE